MELNKTKLAKLYFHELWWLSNAILKKCDQIFNSVDDPDAGYSMQHNPDIHSVIASLLSDAANIRKLILTADVKLKGENGERFKLRKQRVKEIADFVMSLGVKELLNHKVRNTLEHFDEYLDEANQNLSNQPFQGRLAAYNLIMSHWDVVAPEAYPIRLYISSEKKFYNMKWSVDIGLIHSEVRRIIDKMKTLEEFSGKSSGGLLFHV